ncbi:MAG TPA: acyl-CoA carboxylase subunit beta [Acidobacteriota bacterium]|nr:acyl-CoA carboxylase subunit beta [Acidobacteriota bacterium]
MWEELLRSLERDEEMVRLGGGPEYIAKQHSKGRMTSRERIAGLIDAGTEFFELAIFAAFEMYEEWGGAPSAGVVTGVGTVAGRLFMIIANDATVKAGSFFPMTVKKTLRAQRIAMDNRLPLIYLVDSAGVFLPLQDEIFPDEDDFGRIFRNNARLSAMGVPQIAAIMGNCVAGGAYLPVMSDKILMTEGSGLYIAGPSLVKAAIGQELGSEDLGGARLHSSMSGTVDFREPDDESCLRRIREMASLMGCPPRAPFRRESSREPLHPPAELLDLMPINPSREYDVRDIIARLVDGSEFIEYKADFGKTLVCGYARLGGWSVGIVANQKMHVRQPGRPLEVGGVIYTEAADKAARFIMDCNENLIPLLFLHDVNGFMVGRDAEISGIIKSGAKMVNVVSNSVVPKITLIMGGSYGAGHYALCGKAYDPRFILAWPTARYAVMAGASAARTLADLRVRQEESRGRRLSGEEREEILTSITEQYNQTLDPRYAAARLWLDKILSPTESRKALILALEVAAHNPHIETFRTGVLQV